MANVVPQKIVDEGSALSEDESAGEMTWQRPVFDRHLKTVAALRHPTATRKKRVHSASFSHSGLNGVTIDGLPSDVRALSTAFARAHIGTSRALHGKNSRKSRDGRRIPNKRGGKNHENPTDVLDEIVLDHDDPDYDSDVNDPVTIENIALSPTDDEFERVFSCQLKEFFIHGKTEEVIDYMSDMNLAAHQRRRIPYLAITTALQHKQTQYELTSELLSDMCGKVINQAHVQQGFLLVLNELGDLLIDVPKAVEHVGRFIARALADDILPPKFLEFQKSVLSQLLPVAVHRNGPRSEDLGSSLPVSAPPISCEAAPDLEETARSSPCQITRAGQRNFSDSSNGASSGNGLNHSCSASDSTVTTASSGIGSASSLSNSCTTQPEVAMQALVRAESLLTLSHAFPRLDNIWGVPVGPKATKLLVKKISGLLNVYMATGDVDEATEALQELDSPHFHHELVYQAVILAIEQSTVEARGRVIQLLGDLCTSVVITSNQLTLGVHRVYAELPDLQLDVPAAYPLTERFIKEAIAAGFISKKLASELPTKPRKRFVSETDSVYRRHLIKPL